MVATEAAMTIPTRLRQRDILTGQLASCQGCDSSFSRGAAAALCWLTGCGPGPLTGAAAAPIGFRAIVHELAAAEAIIYGSPATGREYARGVEHALLWAEFATSAPPTSSRTAARPAATTDRRDPGVSATAGVLVPRLAPGQTRPPRARTGGPVTNHRRKNEEDTCLREL
jgi:hypothetical protein